MCAMRLAWWAGERVWHNVGVAHVAVRRVNDPGAVWAAGRTKGPRPHCHICLGSAKSTAEAPCGANITISTQPTGDWVAEMSAGAGFGGLKLSGYLAADWYFESHPIARVVRASNETSVQFADSSRCE